jgi:RNA polymerase sigma factor (sigma-70 family)
MRGDVDLLEAWRGGDRAAGEALFERYYRVLERFFANKVGTDPMDLIQETFLGCVAGKERLRSGQRFRSYLFGVAFNQLKTHYRRVRKHGERFDPDTQAAADVSPGPGTMVGKSDEQRLLLQALRRIPVRFQVVLELHYWEELSPAEIAEAVELPEGTVRTRLRRARELLDRALEAVTEDPRLREATRSGLAGWVKEIRAAHGVKSGG